jgi:dienelactone hydrolase
MMKTLTALTVAIGFAAPAMAQMEARPIPAEAFAMVPNIASVSMSEEGDLVAAIIAEPGSDNQRTALATWDLTDPEMPVVITPSGNRMQFTAAAALKSGKVLVSARQEFTGRVGMCGFEGAGTGSTETHIFKTYLTDAEHSEFEDAFEGNARRLGVSPMMQRCLEISSTAGLASILPLDPDHVLISRAEGSTLTTRFYRYNLETGATERVSLNAPGDPAFVDERTAEVLATQDIEPVGDDFRIFYRIKNRQTGEFEEHPALEAMASNRFVINIQGVDDETGEFYIGTDKFSNFVQIYTYDPVSRQFSDEPLVSHPEFSINGLIFGDTPSTFNQIIGFSVSADVNRTEWLDPNLQQIEALLEASFQDTGVGIMDWNDDYSRVLFSTGAGNDPESYYILENLQRVRLLGHSRPWLDEYPMAAPELVYYTARDGLQIPAILTLPAGWTEADGPLPAIVLPHGGPWVRDFANWDFSGWVQFFATRGHAVLQPNYRGSQGMGRELWLAGDAQWGMAMQDDKDDGAAWMVQQGIADPDEIAIFGYSYGGFAAMAATVRQNGPFQCAIAGAGVSNLSRLGNTWSESRLQRIIQGRTVTGMDPADNTDQANIPILIFHGDRDVRVPLFHSTDFYNAVRGQVHAELLVLDGMGHQGNRWYPEHTRDSFDLMEDFLQNDCGPGGLYQ